MIKLIGVEKHFRIGDQVVRALDGIDLRVEKGEFIAVMGRSGSGKTTLLNMLGCMDQPDSGEYWLDGVDVASLDDDALSAVRNHKLGFVFQSFHLLARMTTLENVMLPLQYDHDNPHPDAEARARELLERVDLGDRLHHKPNQLSGGQRQRVAVARALVNRPAVILADEPTGNLDSTTSAAIMDLLCSLHAQGQTIVMVTHEDDIAANAGRVIEMLDGKIIGGAQ
ncbi:MAG: ABC transporter ATP-binding protein [Xanthomonadales bacterium]|nr:ABC transporter ATP-binding protein [Xanthomonadales bacterium]